LTRKVGRKTAKISDRVQHLEEKLGNEERLRSVDEQLKRRTGRGFKTTLRKIT
jgi:hypothetical protein